MPELPEVETVKRELEKTIVGKKISALSVYYPRMVQTSLDEFQTGVVGKTIDSLDRKGKFLIINLSENKKLVFHLRMEGKLFAVDSNSHPTRHLNLLFDFENSDMSLAFYDTRKFGVVYYLDQDEEGPLASLGQEPFDIEDIEELKNKLAKKKPVKELLLDQSIIAGLGNIYADEVLFACSISPFRTGDSLTYEEVASIVKESRRILDLAIENKGSTVRSYAASASVHGEFQSFLKVYDHEGKECVRCHKAKIEKRKLGGRGTSYCPVCQNVGISIGITGKIGSGKSLVLSYFKDLGYKTFSADDEVRRLYKDESFLKQLKKSFPVLFTPDFDKKKLSSLLIEDAAFRRKYQNYLYPKIRESANDFMIGYNEERKALEIPLLFKARMEHDFTYLLGVETSKQKEHLEERGEKLTDRQALSDLNDYDKKRYLLDYVIDASGTKEELYEKVVAVDKDITNKLS